MNYRKKLPIFQVGNVLVDPDIFIVRFCCDLSVCKGQCCVEGQAGPPVSPAEVEHIENCMVAVADDLSPAATEVIKQQGIWYVDTDHDLDLSIVGCKDCVFTFYDQEGICLCALEKAYRTGKTSFKKPISCALYPLREKDFHNGTFGLTYKWWDVCKGALEKGKKQNLPLYQFLKDPLISRFGRDWYDQLCVMAVQLALRKLIPPIAKP
ncbi:MAG: DUF3109 family protein [Prevotella sp.]|jgi:hypothetical protein|nr:DUF3109 family protein [Prevotella sp.]